MRFRAGANPESLHSHLSKKTAIMKSAEEPSEQTNRQICPSYHEERVMESKNNCPSVLVRELERWWGNEMLMCLQDC